MELVDRDILRGAADIHIHVGPDYSPRYADAVQLAKEASEAQMRAIVIKKHLSSTVAEAYLAGQCYPSVKVYGGIALNAPTGGLSLRSVLACLKMGGKAVWLPTTDAGYAMEKAAQGHWIKEYVNGSSLGETVEPLWILEEDGTLKTSVVKIMAACMEYDAILCSGHVGPKECLALAREAQRIGYRKLEITHANDWGNDFTMDICKELASLGATLSIAYGCCSPHNGRQDPHEIVRMIKTVGAEHLVLITDFGQPTNAAPADGMRAFYYLLKRLGITKEELHQMIVTNPLRLLGLEEECNEMPDSRD